jgi:hypothetical protein
MWSIGVQASNPRQLLNTISTVFVGNWELMLELKSNIVIPKVGEIWVNTRPCRDRYGPLGHKMVIVNADEEGVTWNYIPQTTTICTINGSDNGRTTNDFLSYYERDEVEEVIQLLKEYERYEKNLE